MRRWIVPLALLAGSVAVALLVGELALRAMGYSAPIWYQPDASLGWSLRPGVAGWFTREGRAYVEVNASGRRDRDVAPDKPADVYRIAVLGDSYSEAMQVALEQAYWALLPQQLAACGLQPGKRIEVLNFGVSGYGTAQEQVMLEARAMRYRPDLVLLQFTNGNDVKDNSSALSDEKTRPFFTVDADGTLRPDASFASSASLRQHESAHFRLARSLADYSRVAQLVREVRSLPSIGRAHAAGAQDGGVEQGMEPMVLAPPRDQAWEEAWRITEALIRRMGDFAARNGARLVVVTVPYAVQVHPDRQLRQALQAKLGVPDLFYPDRRIAELARRSGILAVPLAPAMQPLAEASGALYHGFLNGGGMGRGHWNPTGHRAAAELIASALCADAAGAAK
jgi:hypothetical protein